MKKMLLLALSLFAVVNIAACATQGKTAAPERKVRLWTDSLGREVEIPEKIEKVAVTGPMAQIVLYALAPELLAGVSAPWPEEVRQYIPDEYLSLPVLGQLYGGKDSMDPEALLGSAPDVVIDLGEPGASVREDLDSLSGQTGLPFVHVSMTTETAGDAFRMLGDLLSLNERAEEYAIYCETVYARALEIAGKAEKTDVLFITGAEGLHVIAKDSYHSEVVDLFCNNLAVVESPSAKGTGNEVDMEQILLWNPEAVIFSPDSIYGIVSQTEEWGKVSAIANGKFYQVPYGPYNWMGFPPSVQRYLGMMWLPAVLYPELCDYSLQDEVIKYYRMFYHTELSGEQYESLIAGS